MYMLIYELPSLQQKIKMYPSEIQCTVLAMKNISRLCAKKASGKFSISLRISAKRHHSKKFRDVWREIVRCFSAKKINVAHRSGKIKLTLFLRENSGVCDVLQ